ncbi:MAG: LamG domain-containing protein, partial [Candidatus Marinimicrobia bacterium]|nr:LamG domain-containing protein [Candidatus Neomarinimicrobiota bacterium]
MKKTLLFFCLMLVCLVLFGQTSIAPSAGDGSEGNPYQIANLENLYWIAADASRWSLYYIQTADIDASETSTWDDGDGGDPEGWTPIGNGTTKLTGSYDGQNHTINGLYINRGSIYGYISLFGYCYGASISNTNLTNVNITGHHYVAGLTGCNEYSAVINCSSSGSVNASGSNIGGLVGWSNTSSSISNSYSICNVNGYSTVGGLVGGNQNSAINRSYSCGSVSGGSEVGGLAGYIYSSSNIANNYSSSSVNGSVYIGGLTGNLYYSTISNCYSYGLISGISEIGGLVGRNTSSTVNMSLWDMETSGQVSSAGGTGKTTAEMQTQSTFTDATWDFTDVWRMNASINDGYPYLQWQTALTEPTISTLYVTDTLIHNALVYYEISDVGNPDSVTHGICWNTSGNPTLADSSNIEGTVDSTGTYSSIMTGLSPNTLYYVRAYATNATGTAYGEVLSFTSLPEAELIAYWNFDEDNTNDVTGMHNGTITGSDVTFVNGKVRRAINFGGSGYGNVEIPSFNLPYITVEAWVNSAKYGYYTSMVTKNYYASSWTSPWVVWELWLNENTPYPATIGSQWHTVSIVPVSMNEWHHMAFTYDGYTVKVYVNGVEKSSAIVDAGPITSTNGNIYIGKPASANHNFIGMIDEVAIWDNALTPEDLLQHYQNGLNALGYVISEPIVSTDSVTEITMTSALCDANITSLGGDSLSAYGVCWGVDPLPTITDDKTDEGSKHVSGTFTSLMPDLSPNTAYYVRAYATNSVGTAYGE